jgi:hypothetical protein
MLACAAIVTLPASAQSGGAYTMTAHVVAGGGATFVAGGSYSLGYTTGQPDASSSQVGGSYSMTGGFWPGAAALRRGDANGDGTIDVADVFYLINALFAGGPQPPSTCVGDANNDGKVDVADVFYLINFLFAGGPPPSPSSC